MESLFFLISQFPYKTTSIMLLLHNIFLCQTSPLFHNQIPISFKNFSIFAKFTSATSNYFPNVLHVRKSTKTHNVPAYLHDYICNVAKNSTSQNSLSYSFDCEHTITNCCSFPKHICFSSLYIKIQICLLYYLLQMSHKPMKR